MSWSSKAAHRVALAHPAMAARWPTEIGGAVKPRASVCIATNKAHKYVSF